jgi:hypothetical protein
MNDPKRSSTEGETKVLGLSQEEDWWNGWRLDEPADSVLQSLDSGVTEDWWAGWHAALLREG